jgi:hypothetical protein
MDLSDNFSLGFRGQNDDLDCVKKSGHFSGEAESLAQLFVNQQELVD